MVGRGFFGHYETQEGTEYVVGLIVEENGTMIAVEHESHPRLIWYNMTNFVDLKTVEQDGHCMTPKQERNIESFKQLGLKT